MKIKILALFSLLFFLQNLSIAQFNMISLNGEDYYINGVNIPWNNFGWDFGRHYTEGVGYDAEWFEAAFADLEANNLNCVRVWVHCDGRANPNFDNNGYVTGLDEGMLEQLDDFVTRANNHSLTVIITLWSHDMFEDYTGSAGRFAGLHSDLITNVEKTNSYVQNALIPIVDHLSNHCNILAWEIMNEPEWGMQIDHGNSTFQTVSTEAMQRFMGLCIEAIRAHSDHYITIGSAMPFGNASDQKKNYWKESEFQKLGFDCSEVYLDFYSIHYYDWMGSGESPFENDASAWELGKPILIAETAAGPGESLSPSDQLNACFENNYAGMLFWSYNANDEFSDWNSCSEASSDFGMAHQSSVLYQNTCDSIYIEKPLLVCNIYPNPASEYIQVPVHFSDDSFELEVDIINAQGGLVKSFQLLQTDTHINIRNLSSGFYYMHLRIVDEQGQLVKAAAQRIVVM